MHTSPKSTRRVPPVIEPPKPSSFGNKTDLCGLRSTLDAYEVEEVSCQDLAQFMRPTALSEGRRE